MHQLVVQPTHLLSQPFFIQGPDLLQQDHGILGQAVIHGGQLNVRRELGLAGLGCDGGGDHRRAVPVACVVLDDKDRADTPCSLPTTGLRSA